MSCFTYIVKCKDESYYTGITNNLARRIWEHDNGIKTAIQRSKRPVELVYWQKFSSRSEATKKEKEIKGWRREKKETLIRSLSLH